MTPGVGMDEGYRNPQAPQVGVYSHSREQSGSPQMEPIYIDSKELEVHKEACSRPLPTALFAGQCGGDSLSFNPGEWISHT